MVLTAVLILLTYFVLSSISAGYDEAVMPHQTIAWEANWLVNNYASYPAGEADILELVSTEPPELIEEQLQHLLRETNISHKTVVFAFVIREEEVIVCLDNSPEDQELNLEDQFPCESDPIRYERDYVAPTPSLQALINAQGVRAALLERQQEAPSRAESIAWRVHPSGTILGVVVR